MAWPDGVLIDWVIAWPNGVSNVPLNPYPVFRRLIFFGFFCANAAIRIESLPLGADNARA